jgi:tripartite-type tricarboxylate transporter receptor subunit TctC
MGGSMAQILWVLIIVMWTSYATAQSHFYQGKAITVVAGANAGGTYDL